MFDNVALNVVIGLIFIYLLYSLFATVLSEMIATSIGLRARNLKEAVDRMLNDEIEGDKGFLRRLWDSIKLMKNPKNPRVTNFYNHPEIKYLGSTGVFKVPSQFKAVSFSKTILNLLNEIGYKKLEVDNNTIMNDPDEGDIKGIPVTEITKERITKALEGIIQDHKNLIGEIEKYRNEIAINIDKINEAIRKKDKIVLDHETAKYVFILWKESYGDLTKFKLQLETWFDRTMEQCTEWYKRKIQVVLFVLGFLIAWFFNADTFTIISKLSTDKDARDKIVTLAAAYNQNNLPPTSPNLSIPPEKLDSLNNVKNKLEQDIASANTILGLGGWPPDIVNVSTNNNTKTYNPQIDIAALTQAQNNLSNTHIDFRKGDIWIIPVDKWIYFFRLFPTHFFGFLITAIAISLGAPFWFDLLNKVMKLRTAVKQSTNTAGIGTVAAGTVSPLNREG